ncbi:MAG: biopolymer transporter ExbD [Treponema sp.]|nr:biopolymer transporter ExbD [Treponema sp.]
MKLTKNRKAFFIPLFSMSDIAFLLLIFIMLVSLINYRQEVNIEFPQANMALKTTAEKNLEIWIDIDGEIYLDGNLSDASELEKTISHLYTTAPDTRVHIIADRNVQYEKINSIIEIMQILQYRVVSFVVKTHE